MTDSVLPAGYASVGVPTKQFEIRPLRIPIVPVPGESLPGLLARATRLNVVESTFSLLAGAGVRRSKGPGTISVASATDLQALSLLFGCSVTEVESCSTPLDGSLQKMCEVRLGDVVLRRPDLELKVRRISPETLREQEHHSKEWLLRLLPYCTKSLELLRSDCSHCGKILGWSWSWGIATCEYCERLVRSSGKFLPAELVDDYRLFAGLFSSDVLTRKLSLEVLPPEIASIDSRTMLEFALELGAACRIEPVNLRRRDMNAFAPLLLAQIVSRGAALLASWPIGVRQWCERSTTRASKDSAAYKAIYLAMRKLCRKSVARPAQIAIMKGEFPELFLNFNRSFAVPGTFLLGTEACRFTSLSSGQLTALRVEGILKARKVPAPDGQRAKFQYDKLDLAALSLLLRNWVKARRVAWQIGIPLNAIEQMCCLDILDQVTDPAVCHLYSGLMITRTSLQVFLDCIAAGAIKGKSPDAIPLGTAARVIGGRMKPWEAIFASLLHGDIEFWLGDGPSLVRRIRIDPRSMSQFEAIYFDETAWPLFPF